MIGAGKVARGFIGHLLCCSDFDITFVDVDERLVAQLASRSTYSVHVLGAPGKDVVVGPVQAYAAGNRAPITDAVRTCDVMFVSVGGANLDRAAGALAPSLEARLGGGASELNVIVCENWRAAGETFRRAVLRGTTAPQRAAVDARLGVAESTILRSCIDPTVEQRARDPLAVQVQDFWRLPVDGSALVAELPPVLGVEPIDNFANALERKLYTYNMGNAVISYLGWLRGYAFLSEAARDDRVLPWVQRAFAESGEALCRRFGYAPADQRDFASAALRKFQTVEIVDPLERQVKDPIRKLGRHDRLVGAAMLAEEEHVEPVAIAYGIAAALRHRNPDDPQSERLQALISEHGELGALEEIGGVPVGSPVSRLVGQHLGQLDPHPGR